MENTNQLSANGIVKDDTKNYVDIQLRNSVLSYIIDKLKGANGMENEISKNNDQRIEAALQKADEKIGKALNKSDEANEEENKEKDIEHTELDDLDDVDLATIEKLEKKGVRIIYPNLKYRKPKYQNVSEVLKYVESENGKGDGVKLVIMNFND